MKLAIINGSPRGENSNSKLLTDNFLLGFNRICNTPVPVHYLANSKLKNEGGALFLNAEIVIFIFPLYTDSMPGVVKEFFEGMARLNLTHPKKIGFIVHSGFPESVHSISLERYLEKFTGRLQCEYLGTVIRGGTEGIRVMPPLMTKKLFGKFQELGEYFAEHQLFLPKIVKTLRKPYRLSSARKFIYNTIGKTGITNFYWNSNLKKNNAFEKRFNKPFGV